MKCWVHPEEDAVAFCKTCGKGVCQDCLVVFGGDNYCKTCIESGRVVAVVPSPEPTVAESVPVPKARPSRAFFVVGGVGCVVIAIAAIWFFLASFETFAYFQFFWVIGHALLIIGLVLASVGYLGMRRNYGSGIGVASFAVAIVVSVLFSFWTVWRTVGTELEYNWLLNMYVWSTIYEIFFVMMILWGVTHLTTRRFSGKSGLSLASGIMHIITAVFLEITTSLWVVFEYQLQWHYYEEQLSALLDILKILDPIWAFLFFTSEILAAILFFIAKVPELSTKPNQTANK